MKVIYSDQTMVIDERHHSIFLAGPTPRDKFTPSWRPEAVRILEEIGYSGTVLVPERSNRTVKIDYLDQVEWENAGLMTCKCVVFWIPRNIETMPAFTTNVEFGRFVTDRSGRCFYGRPDDAPKNRYLDWLYNKFYNNPQGYNIHRPIYNNLTELLTATIK